jgi:3-methyladenine DNA glycosylase AlkD
MHPIEKELRKYATRERAEMNAHYFKSGKGEYGEGDLFLGVTVPDTRAVAHQFADTYFSQLTPLLESPWHEVRLVGLLILVEKLKNKNASGQGNKAIVDYYLQHLSAVNNWDLVDLSADKILGQYYIDTKSSPQKLYALAQSRDLWERRIAIIATLAFIREHTFSHTKKIAEMLMHDEHDLMHKAVGWMLREMGKRNEKELVDFLKKHYQQMPRTMLRYSIEKFPEDLRKKYLNGEI